MTKPDRGLVAILIVLGLLASAAARAGAQAISGGVTTQAGFDQELGAKLPLAAHFRDESGRELPLGDYFGRRPVILAPVYFGCPLLCGQVLAGLARSLKPLSLEAGRDFDVIAFSIDPDEGPAMALAKKTVYLERYDRPGTESGWHFLTGEQASIRALAEKIGFRYTYNPQTKLFTHAAGVVIVTPEGVVSRYFFGIDYPPKELQLELERARAGRVGSRIGRLLLLCYDYDAATGKYTLSILRLIRVLGTATAVSLAGFLFVMFRREGRDRRLKDERIPNDVTL
ncbi:MAG TPA: SCO family protein [Chloroflexota bacterium]|jgi:protein SCO1/2|nr:SCO family protein [Chloroflexota bacterium]